jgi:integrase
MSIKPDRNTVERAIRLTEVAVSKLTGDPDRRREIRDAGMDGLVLRISPEGRKSWSVLYRVAGASESGKRGPLKRITLGTYPMYDLKTARDKAREVMDNADRGRDPVAALKVEIHERNDRVMRIVFDRYINAYAKINTKNWKGTKTLLEKYVNPTWGAIPINEITRRQAHELLDGYVAVGRISTAREIRRHLTRVFNWAVDRDIIQYSPLSGMKRPEIAYRPRERVLTMKELQAIWDATDDMGYPFGNMYRMLILTGQRKGEVANMHRSWMVSDLKAIEIPAAAYKTKRPHLIPLSEPALKLVAELPKWNIGDYMFSTTAGARPISGYSKAKLRLDELSKVEGWVVHDIRRSVATHMARLGVSQEHIERVLGHVIEGVAGTYNRYSYVEEKRAALELWGRQWEQ